MKFVNEGLEKTYAVGVGRLSFDDTLTDGLPTIDSDEPHAFNETLIPEWELIIEVHFLLRRWRLNERLASL